MEVIKVCVAVIFQQLNRLYYEIPSTRYIGRIKKLNLLIIESVTVIQPLPEWFVAL